MGASGFGPAPHINPNEFERRLTEGGGREAAPSRQLPHAARSWRAPSTFEFFERSREQSGASAKARASERVGDFQGRSSADLLLVAQKPNRASNASAIKRTDASARARASERVGEFEGRSPSMDIGAEERI